MKRLILLLLAAAIPCASQTINPNQIRPAGTNGYVLTTVGGATVWAPGGGGSGPTLQTNSVNNASQTLLNLEQGNNVVLTNTSGGNVRIDAGTGTTLPPPFPVPNGQAVAWAYPTACTSGSSSPGTNGIALCGPESGYVAQYSSGPLANCCWTDHWNGFVMPTLPGDAVIQGVYGVQFVQHTTEVGFPAADGSGNCDGSNLNAPTPAINFTGEYYTASLGSTSAAVTGASCAYGTSSSLGPETVFDQNIINQVAIAIYYTTAFPPLTMPYSAIPQSINLQVNGTTSTDQGLLNLTSSAPIVVADNGTGTWTISCPSCGGTSAVAQVTNSDGTLAISPTTGNVVASLALGHANTWTAAQTIFTNSSTPTALILDSASTCCTQFEITNSTGGNAYNFFTNGSLSAGNYGGIFNVTTSMTPLAFAGSSSLSYLNQPSVGVHGWTNSTTRADQAPDTGLSRDSAGVVDFGTGALGSIAGSFKATNGTLSGTLTLSAISGSTQCLQVNSSGLVSGTGSACGSGGSTAFSALTGSTNTTAAMVVGTGASLATSGSGSINATLLGGVALSGLCQTGGTGCPQLAVTKASVSHQFFTSYTSTTGLFTAAQPAFPDISGQATLAQLPNGSANSVLLGYGAAGSGSPPVQITLGTNLSMSGTTLNAIGGGSGTVTDGAGTTTAGIIPESTTSAHVLDYGSNLAVVAGQLQYSGAGGFSVTPTSGDAGVFSLSSNTTLPTLTPGQWNLIGANSASVTAFGWQVPTAVNGSAGVLHVGAPTSSVSQLSVSLVSLTADVTGILPTANGGTGVNNTATLTLGTSNQNWATLGTGIVKNTTTTGAITDAASADVIGLWTGTCSSSTFLRGDGSCVAPGGSGTVTSVSFTGGLISVATPTSTPAFTVAGTSGGVPYFSTASTWASSAALTASGVVLGGGAGTAPKTVAGLTTDGTSIYEAGVAGTSVGKYQMFNATSGSVTLAPATGALGSVTATFPANTGTVGELNLAQTWTALQTFGANASIAATAHGVLLSENTSAVVATAVGATNTVLHGNTGADPTYSAVTGSDMSANTVTATQLAAQYSKGSCTEVWGGSGTSFALTSGDDAISNNTCYNDSGVTRTITAVKCRSDIASNTTTVNPTFGSAGTGTTILSGALTCGSSLAYSSTGTVTNASWTTGAGINPAMGGTLTGTSIAVIVEYTY